MLGWVWCLILISVFVGGLGGIFTALALLDSTYDGAYQLGKDHGKRYAKLEADREEFERKFAAINGRWS